MAIKVTYIISNINKALAFEWIAEEINRQKIELSFILLNPAESELETSLKQLGFLVKRITYHNKKSIPFAIIETIRFLKREKINIVHTHLFDANIVGLIAAKLAGIKKRIYTRHHSSYHHEYYPHAIKYDKLCNALATDIIAITATVRDILIKKEGVSYKKIITIEHGFKLSVFEEQTNDAIYSLKQKYNPADQAPVVGVISRYTEWKGIQYIIPAFKKILQTYPNAKLILANANGNYSREIKELLKTIPFQNYTEIIFEKELGALYQLFDVFVHTPIDNHSEAFGQTYIEALAVGIPSVFTLSGIANDFIIHKKNALVVDYKNPEAIFESIFELLNDTDLSRKLVSQGKIDVRDRFKLSKMIVNLESLYLENLNVD